MSLLVGREYVIERKQQSGDKTHFLGNFSERIDDHFYKFIGVTAYYWSQNGWTDIVYQEKVFDDRYYDFYLSHDGGKGKKRSLDGKSKKKKKSIKKLCRQFLSQKIQINIGEKKRYKSRQQAIAVAYAQIRKSFPKCKKFFKRSSSPSYMS